MPTADEEEERAALLSTGSSIGNGPARYDGRSISSGSSGGAGGANRRRPPPLDGDEGVGGGDVEEGSGEPHALRKPAPGGMAPSRTFSSDFLRSLSSSLSFSYGPLVTRGGGCAEEANGHGSEHRSKKDVGQKWQSLDVYQSLAGVTRHPSLAHEVWALACGLWRGVGIGG